MEDSTHLRWRHARKLIKSVIEILSSSFKLGGLYAVKMRLAVAPASDAYTLL